METQNHWNNIFKNVEASQQGWYEKEFSQTLKFLEKIEELETKDIFVCGVGTSKIADILVKRFGKTILNDISDEALNILRERIKENNVEFFNYDVSKSFQKKCDIWFDRAVLHFLIEENEKKRYFENLKNSLVTNGYVLFSEFAKQDVTKCANLPLYQYSVDEFSSRLGKDFKLVKDEFFEYTMPWGDTRIYLYALFKKIS